MPASARPAGRYLAESACDSSPEALPAWRQPAHCFRRPRLRGKPSPFTLVLEKAVFLDPILTKVFGTANERLIKRMRPIVSQISAMEPEIQKLSDEELRAKTTEFRARIAAQVAERTKAYDQQLAIFFFFFCHLAWLSYVFVAIPFVHMSAITGWRGGLAGAFLWGLRSRFPVVSYQHIYFTPQTLKKLHSLLAAGVTSTINNLRDFLGRDRANSRDFHPL